MDDDEGYYYTGQTPFRKPDESRFRYHARRLLSIQTLGRLEYTVEEAESKFNRSLGPIELTFVGLGAVVGSGVFVILGTAASTQTGPSISIAYLLGGIVSGIAALSYAEMASMIPIAGSAYTYAYATVGELPAWMIGWNLILEYMVGAATVSVGFSSYFVSFMNDAFGVELSKTWTTAPVVWEQEEFLRSDAYFNVPAFVVSILVTIAIYTGIHFTARINNVLVAFKILALVIIIFALIPSIKSENYHPYIPPNQGKSGHFGVSGLLEGAASVFFAYIGFDSVSTTAQEAKDPQVNIPIGIMMTLAISTTLYISMSAVAVGVAHYTHLTGGSPLVKMVQVTGMHWLVVLTELGAIAATISVILVLLIAQPRVFYAMANDGLIPRVFAKVHPKLKTPYVATLVSGIVCAFCGALLPTGVLSDMSSIGTIVAFFVVNVGVIILRYTRKTVPRRFKVPGGIFLPLIGAASSLLLLMVAKRDSIIRLLVWMAVGVLVYFMYGRTHSEVNNPRMTNEPMQVVHENYSIEGLNNYQGYADDYLRQQYERQLNRRESGVMCPADNDQARVMDHPRRHPRGREGRGGEESVDVVDLGDVDGGAGTSTSTTRGSGATHQDEQGSDSLGPSTEHSSIPIHNH
ncbi:Cationic amino acid transporter-1 [Mortierella sp. NVP85]|nr:Cationic amino acid transporter-1 [Mortierella sp. NVP85]